MHDSPPLKLRLNILPDLIQIGPVFGASKVHLRIYKIIAYQSLSLLPAYKREKRNNDNDAIKHPNVSTGSKEKGRGN